MSSVFIKNARVIDPANGIDDILNIYAENGIIKDVSKNEHSADTQLNCSGLIAAPGLVDMHVHYTWSHEINTPDYPTKKEELLA